MLFSSTFRHHYLFTAVQHTYIMTKAAKTRKPAMPELNFEQAVEKKNIKAIATKAKKDLEDKVDKINTKKLNKHSKF